MSEVDAVINLGALLLVAALQSLLVEGLVVLLSGLHISGGASLWQPVAHFTLTASVFTVINQWWPGGCHFAPCGARPRLGSAPQTHSRPWWGDRAAHTHMHMHSLIDARTPTGWAHTQKKLYAQHKAGCWSNYRNMAEHDEAGPTIRREIEWAKEKWWRH